MNDGGYTLAETLVALAMIGLTVGGVVLGVQVIGRAQSRLVLDLARIEGVRTAKVALEQQLSGRDVMRSVDPMRLSGASQRFQFACDQPQPCEARLLAGAPGQKLVLRLSDSPERTFNLGAGTHPGFLYSGSETEGAVWPPSGGPRQVLKAITVMADEGPVLVAHLWAEQPAACDFDVVLKDCR